MTLKDKDRVWCVTDQSAVFEIELIEDRTYWFDAGGNDCDPGEGEKHINFKTKLIGPKTPHTEYIHRAHFSQVWHDDLDSYKHIYATQKEANQVARKICERQIAEKQSELNLLKERLSKMDQRACGHCGEPLEDDHQLALCGACYVQERLV